MGQITKEELTPSLVSEIEQKYELPIASATTLGGIMASAGAFNVNPATGNLTLANLAAILTPTAQGGANVSGTTFYMDKYGVVDIHISATLGFKTAGTVLFTLPNNYKPMVYAVYTVTATTPQFDSFNPYALIITVEGNVVLPADFPSDKDVIIGNISFRTR